MTAHRPRAHATAPRLTNRGAALTDPTGGTISDADPNRL
jgi:hypothetical protein